MRVGMTFSIIKETVRHFLSRDGLDSCGRSLENILAWSDDELEFHHDFIQWLFPLETSSRANSDAPVLTRLECSELGQDRNVRAGLRDGFKRMLRFYGLEWRGTEIIKSTNWDARCSNWAWTPTHNDLRITRILHSLSLFGLSVEALAFLRFLENMVQENSLNSSRRATLTYWQNAVKL
jgi:hypothetical protein